MEPEWIQAFIDGERSFQFLISDSLNRGKSYLQVYSRLEIVQHSHDIKFLAAINKYFSEGYLKPQYNITSIEAAIQKYLVVWVDIFPLIIQLLLLLEINILCEHKNT